MPDLWMDVDAALAEVPVNILPLIDDTDFKAREVGITYDQAGMDLVWNFCTTAGAMTQTAVTPTTGGDYDWAHQGDGMYSIEIPASGGASINNDTEGFGWFSGFCTGVLPWRGPIVGFRAAALNNVLIDAAYSATRGLAGTALPDAVADAAGGLPISDAGGLDIDAILADTNELQTDWTNAGRLDALIDLILADTGELQTDWVNAGRLDAILDLILADTGELQTDDVPGLISTHDGKLDTVDGIVDTILVDTNELQTDWVNAGRLDALIDLILADTGELQSDDVPGLISTHDGKLDTVDGIVDTILVDTNELQTDDVPGLISTHDGKLDTVDGIADTILVDTNELQTDWANAGRLDALIDLILADTGELQTDWADGGRLDLLIDAILADTGELQTDWANGGRLDLLIDAILADSGELQTDWANGGRLDLLIDAIKAVTDNLPNSGALNDLATILTDTGELQTDWANGGRLDLLIDAILADTNELQTDDVPGLIGALNDLSSANVGDAVLDEAVESTETLRQLLRLMRAVLIGKSQGGGTTTPDFRDRGDTKNRVTFTADSDGNRTASTTDPS